ncbi:MAG: class I SAM-dependent methyltransferase [Flavobacteriales bacterium]|nr:class I SAM-dependent methyltransferase [Flavobacteriales bacterium]
MRYNFEKTENCEMCGSSSEGHKLLGLRLNRSQGLHPKRKGGIAVSIYKCLSCGLLYSDPMPIPENIQDHYGKPPEEYWKGSYFKIDPNYFTTQIKQARALLGDIKIKSLDIGAGLGKAMIAMEAQGFDAFGLEPSQPFYERAISEMKVKEERLELGSVESSEYPDSTFDFITFGAVFEHLYHPAESLEKALRWLKPNGIIHIEVPSSNWLIAKIIDIYYSLRGTNYTTHLSPMHTPYHLYEFSIGSFHKLGQRLNFKTEVHQIDTGSVYFFPKFTHGMIKKIMNWTKTGMQLTVYLRKV